MGSNLFQKFVTAETSVGNDFNIYGARDGQDGGRIGIEDLFSSSAVPILKPVADLPALHALPTAVLVLWTRCYVISEKVDYMWNGTAWVISTVHPEANSPTMFDAEVDANASPDDNAYTTLTAAINSGASVILLNSDLTETFSLTLTKPLYLYINKEYRFTSSGNIDTQDWPVVIKGAYSLAGRFTYAPTSAGTSEDDDNAFFVDTAPSAAGEVYFEDVDYSNNSSYAHTPLTQKDTIRFSHANCNFISGNADNAGIRMDKFSTGGVNALISLGGPNASRALIMNQGVLSGVTFSNNDAPSGALMAEIGGSEITIYDTKNKPFTAVPGGQCVLDGVVGTGITPFKINANGAISNLKTSINISIECTGQYASLSDVNVKGGDISITNVAPPGDPITIEKIVGCTAGTFTPNNGIVKDRAGNNAVIGNDYGQAGIDEFTAVLDGSSTGPLKYATLSAAYAASKDYVLSEANITETASTVLTAAAKLYFKIGQNTRWNQADKSIDGTANGARFTLEMADASSIYEYNFPASEYPIKAFDSTSTLVIKGNGGIIQNTSTVNGAQILSLGKMIIQDVIFQLPNQIEGGIQTNTSAYLNNITFTGGGAACEKGISISGGLLSNLSFIGTWKSNGFLNNGDAPSSVSNLSVATDGPVTFIANGNLSNFGYEDNDLQTAAFLVDIKSNTSVSNGTCTSAVFLTGIVNCKISNVNFDQSVSFSTDNTNDKITFVNCTFEEDVQVYGTNMVFSSCHFNGNITTDTNSNGAFVACDCGGTVTNNGTFRREANDGNIGNDSGGSVPLPVTGSHTTDWTGIWDTDQAGAISYSVWENRVYLKIPQVISIKNTTAAWITNVTPLPANLRPNTTIIGFAQILDNGTLGIGAVSVDSSGTITITKGADAQQFSTSGGSNGGFNNFPLNYLASGA